MTDTPEYEERPRTVKRTARVGSIGTVGPATTDVWIVLHGYGQRAGTLAGSAAWPVATHRAFIFPEALQRFYDAAPGESHRDAPVGASWMTRDARDDDIADNHAYLDAVWSDVVREAPRAALTVLGFSQGAATAVRWSETLIRRGTAPARLILWGGALPPDADLSAASPLRAIPVHIVLGTRDRWVTLERSNAEKARLAEAAFPVTMHEFAGGHRLDDAMLVQLAG